MSAPARRAASARRLLRPRLGARTIVQIVVFTGSNGLVSLLGAVSKALLARALTVASFGAFSFATSFLQLAALVFEFGVFVPASRLAARTSGRERREIIGAALVAYVPLAVAFAAAIFGLSFVVDSVFRVDAGHALRVVAPLTIVYPFGLIALQLTQGADRLHVYSITAVLSQLTFVAMLGIVTVAALKLSTASSLVLRSISMVAGSVVLAVWLRPVFRNLRRHLSTLVAHARDWGFKVYVGRVLSVGTYNMDVVMLGALTDARSVAFYTLAGAAAYALGLPVSGMASALFPRMAREGRLHAEWLALAWALGAVSIVFAAVLGRPFLDLVFSSSYADAARYIVALTLAQAIRGVTSIYNSYLSSQAAGRALRDAGVVLTVSNLVLNFALIPPFGAIGAAWASVAALAANLVAHVLGYRRLQAAGPPAGVA